MLSGKVKWFNYKNGYGFITPDDAPEGAKDVFVHITAVHEAGLRGLDEGQAISYELKEENGKTCATNLTLK
ncbi:MAG: cold-shock protein [Alphaproteobacteria bacterium]|nr:cold-shock protein [Alphaproteobacteria bacterium]